MQLRPGRRVRVSWTMVLFVVSLSTAVAGQTIRPGSIGGTLTDESGGVLPGVTVTVTSPALQVSSITTVPGARGEYQVLNLPPGTFRVAYDLTGFATLVREEIAVSAGFTARVDVAMKLASQTETVTVTGQGPTVDTTSTRGGATVSKELIDSLPSAHNYQDILRKEEGRVVAAVGEQ